MVKKTGLRGREEAKFRKKRLKKFQTFFKKHSKDLSDFLHDGQGVEDKNITEADFL